jgi:predicted nucleic acid-binding protein
VVYFFDSSALVKLYHPEKGSERIEEIFNEPDRRILIARLAGVEIVSALALKVRTGHLDALTATSAARKTSSLSMGIKKACARSMRSILPLRLTRNPGFPWMPLSSPTLLSRR